MTEERFEKLLIKITNGMDWIGFCLLIIMVCQLNLYV
jgi:hypothetical protein